jgi:hypothetical protein
LLFGMRSQTHPHIPWHRPSSELGEFLWKTEEAETKRVSFQDPKNDISSVM